MDLPQGASSDEASIEAALRELQREYAVQLGDQVARLVAETESVLRTSPTRESLETLRRTAHSMKGCAGSYGFDSVSLAAGHLETCFRSMALGSKDDFSDRLKGAAEELSAAYRGIALS